MLRVRKSLRPELTVLASALSNENAVVVDNETGEIGDFLTLTRNNYLLVEWRGEDELIEVISPNKYSVSLLDNEQWAKVLSLLSGNDVEWVENPFGSWFKEKATGYTKRRKATKAFSKRLKAETALDKAKKDEADAIAAAKGNSTGGWFGRKDSPKRWAVTCRNKDDSGRIGGAGEYEAETKAEAIKLAKEHIKDMFGSNSMMSDYKAVLI